MVTEQKKIHLDEVTLMRTILAVMIVTMHSFTCYQGGWSQPEGYIDTPQKLIISWIIFIAVFIILRPLKETIVIGDQNFRLYKLLNVSARGACQLIYATIGTITFYITTVYFTRHRQLNKLTISLASSCFGIYLIHQFLLIGLYYNTNFAAIVGPYWLPWLGVALVLPVSYLLSTILLKTKVGKFLIG